MLLPKNVRLKKWYWNLFPWVNYKTMQAFYPNIYLPPTIFYNLKSNNPDPYNIARLKHEQTHISRIQKKGISNFFIKYMFSSKFRFEEELEANRVAMQYIKSRNLSWDIENTARRLSSWLYFWPVPYKIAKSELQKIWNNLN